MILQVLRDIIHVAPLFMSAEKVEGRIVMAAMHRD